MDSAAGIEQMLEDVKVELDEVTQRPDAEAGGFVLEADIKRIWRKSDRLSKLFQFDWALEDCGRALEFIRINLLKVVSILVAIHWRDWSRFNAIFINQPSHRLDKDLPFTSLNDLKQQSFLRSYGKDFYEKQWTFLPIVIEAGKAERHPRERRLPFLRSEYINKGGSATVHKVTITAGYFSSLNAKNDMDFEIARKVVYTQDRFTIETGNLNQLRGCLSSHRRIMINLATIIHDTEHGTTFNILYDLACFDLNEFVHDLPVYQTYIQEHPDHFSTFRDIDFIQEASILADALHFLHHGLWDGAKVGCIHNDLKPDNILVVWLPDRRYPDEVISPVGKWKIADFGISRIKQAKDHEPEEHNLSTSSQYLAPIPPRDLITRFSPDTSRRPPGAYSAPEIEKEGALLEDGRKSDVWSYGCVLTLVLAFALGGSTLVKEFEGQQFQHTVHTHSRFYESTQEGIVLKPTIRNWLLSLAHRFPDRASWISPYVNLVLRMLMINFTDRPSAGEVRNELSRIFRSSPSPSRIGLGISVNRSNRHREEELQAAQLRPNQPNLDSEPHEISFPVPSAPYYRRSQPSVPGTEQAVLGASSGCAETSHEPWEASRISSFSSPSASAVPFTQSGVDPIPILTPSPFERTTSTDPSPNITFRDSSPEIRRDSGLDINPPIVNRFNASVGASMLWPSPPLEHSRSSSLPQSSHTSSASDPPHLRPTPLDERSTFARIGFGKVGGKNYSAGHCVMSPDGDIGVTWNKKHAIIHCLPTLDLKAPGEADSWYPKSPKGDGLSQKVLDTTKGWQIELISIAGSFKTNLKVSVACHLTEDEQNMVSIYKVYPTPLSFYAS
ncbi:kinase-like protein [Glonium stellatum]|uniref:non-specific serine/threonine protein kinase n=1 Tax=Glonium stellatum TaxID=574774 RepID=A0A8E2F6L6_9PEZI|nr:kinase-like protein [Glonium stellatum]